MDLRRLYVYLIIILGHAPGLFVAIDASAQDAGMKQVQGIVRDAQSKELIIGAVIQSLESTHTAITDQEGHFEFQVPLLTKAVAISYLGFEPDTMAIPSDGQSWVIELKASKALSEVEIASRKKSTEINLLGTMKTEHIGSRELMKAACCNLSESFETTPSVDVGFTDAVSGYKQIQMLGLAGTYTSFTRENIPDIRGLAAISGLTFTPGAWVESMQLSKGAGSVVNGYEGTAGQINIEWVKPFEEKEPQLYLNGYQSAQGRSEGNLVLNHRFNDNLSSNLLLHGRSDWAKVDQNKDGFLDQPLGKTFVGANRWFYFHPKGIEIQGGVKGTFLDNTGGQKDYISGTEQAPGNPWGYEQQVKRMEAWAKIGKVFVDKQWRSMGLQLSGLYHDQESRYGRRSYEASQNSFYANYIYQTIIGNTNHVFKGGASFLMDNYDESFVGTSYKRSEYVPGAFVEYSYKYLTRFNIVAGLRADYHNLFGAFVTPRLHVRYEPWSNAAFRASIGRAQRTANIFAENLAYLASNRDYVLRSQGNASGAYGLNPEVAWNMGLNFTQKFRLNYRDGAFSTDYYFTDFTNQVIVDIESPHNVKFYNLDGQSFAHSFQAQLDYEPIRKLDVRLAYRFYDVRSTYNGLLKEKPLIAAHRAFMNLGYETKKDWKFDYTLQWIGSKRLPERMPEGIVYVKESYTPSFIQMNAQISKSWKEGKRELYLGGENLTGLMQHRLIQGAHDPFGANFDGSLVWGPGMGRNFYLGFRYKL